jgi:hypothetical protein
MSVTPKKIPLSWNGEKKELIINFETVDKLGQLFNTLQVLDKLSNQALDIPEAIKVMRNILYVAGFELSNDDVYEGLTANGMLDSSALFGVVGEVLGSIYSGSDNGKKSTPRKRKKKQ